MSFINFIQNFGIQFLLSIIIGYLFGSISFSIIFTKQFERTDIRNMGSGNAGFTNVLRSAGVLPSLLTLVFDFLKCAIAIYIANIVFYLISGVNTPNFIALQTNIYLTGLACIVGHIYPCFFGFKGGKGVLTAASFVLVSDWRVFLICISIFLIVLYFSRIVSLSSIIAVGSLPIVVFIVKFVFDYLPGIESNFSLSYVILATVFYLLIATLIIFKHKNNIHRLLLHEEKKIKPKSKS